MNHTTFSLMQLTMWGVGWWTDRLGVGELRLRQNGLLH